MGVVRAIAKSDPDYAYDFSWYFGSLDVENWSEVNSGDKPLDIKGAVIKDAYVF